MMQVVCCDNCGNSHIALDAVSVNVLLTKMKHCDKCYNSKEQVTSYFFCSEDCFSTYIRKVVEKKAEFKFDRYEFRGPKEVDLV